MSTLIDFEKLVVGNEYARKELAEVWGYQGFQGLSRGVITPRNSNVIILFVTKDKQASLPQYSDYIIDDFLYWDGESGGGNNSRIIGAEQNGDDIYLFYRARHHQNFTYKGIVALIEVLNEQTLPHQFLFKVLGEPTSPDNPIYEPVFPNNHKATDSRAMALSRIGQGKFRTGLFKLWDGCAVNSIHIPELLRASHIKPWKSSDAAERLDPYNGLLLSPIFDTLFDKGFISFDDHGKILLSKQIMDSCEVLSLSGEEKLVKVYNSNKVYLEYHREHVFLK